MDDRAGMITTAQRIAPEEIRFHPTSFCDRNGRLFTWRGGLYRGLSREGAAHFRRLRQEGLLDRLIEQHLLVETEESGLEAEGFAIVLRHRQLPFVSYASEWSPRMLRDATLMIAQLELELAGRGWTVNRDDAAYGNLLFDGCRPVFVDLGAIVPESPEHEGFARRDFRYSCWFAARQALAGRSSMVRTLLRPEHEHLLAEWGEREMDGGAWRKLEALGRRARRGLFPSSASSWRIELMQEAIRDLESARLPEPGGDMRFESVPELAEIAAEWQPHSVLVFGETSLEDLASVSRAGHFALVVCSAEESYIDLLYTSARENNSRMLPLVMDLRFPTAGSGVCLREYPAAATRLASEMVVAVGVVERLVFQSYLSFEQIAAALAEFSKRSLAVVFREPEGDNELARRAADPFFHWYRRENLELALAKHFRQVESRSLSAKGAVAILGHEKEAA